MRKTVRPAKVRRRTADSSPRPAPLYHELGSAVRSPRILSKSRPSSMMWWPSCSRRAPRSWGTSWRRCPARLGHGQQPSVAGASTSMTCGRPRTVPTPSRRTQPCSWVTPTWPVSSRARWPRSRDCRVPSDRDPPEHKPQRDGRSGGGGASRRPAPGVGTETAAAVDCARGARAPRREVLVQFGRFVGETPR